MPAPDLHTYRCTVQCGHMGTGKHIERDVYIRAANATRAFTMAKYRGGVKKGHRLHSGASVLQVVRVD